MLQQVCGSCKGPGGRALEYPHLGVAHFRLGACLAHLGYLEEALAEFEHALGAPAGVEPYAPEARRSSAEHT